MQASISRSRRTELPPMELQSLREKLRVLPRRQFVVSFSRARPPVMSSATPDRAERFTRVHLLVLALLSMGMAAAYLVRVPGAYNTTLQSELKLSYPEVAAALAGFEFGYIWLQIPGGWFGLKFGNRRVLPLMCLGWSLSAVQWALARDADTIYYARLGMGLFQGALIPCSAMAMSEWFPPRLRGMTSGVITSSMQVGGIAALQLTAVLLLHISWRWILGTYAAVGVLWAIALYALFRDRPGEHPWLRSPEVQTSPEPRLPLRWQDAAPLLISLPLWLLCAQMVFRAYAYTFIAVHFPSYLEKGRGLPKLDSSTLTVPLLVATLIGGLVGGTVIDILYRRTGSKYVSRSGTAILSMLAAAACSLAATSVTDARTGVAIITCGAFFAGVAGPVTWAAVIDVFGKRTAVLIGLVNMCGNIGAYLSVTSIGRLIGYIEKTHGNWNWVLYLIAGIYAAAALLWVALDPSRARVED